MIFGKVTLYWRCRSVSLHQLLILKLSAACYFSLSPNTMKDLKSLEVRRAITRCEGMGEGDEVSSHDRCVVKFYVSMQVF